MKQSTVLMLQSYARAFAASALAVWWAGETSLDAILKAGLVAVVPPLLRWLNPNDPSFGRTNW